MLHDITEQLEFLCSNHVIVHAAWHLKHSLLHRADEKVRRSFEDDKNEINVIYKLIERDIEHKLWKEFGTPIQDAYQQQLANNPNKDFLTLLRAAEGIQGGYYLGRESHEPLRRVWESLETRLIANVFSSTTNWVATSLEPLPSRNLLGTSRRLSMNDLYTIVLRKLPTPSPIVSWEDIIQFRNEPEQRKHLSALRLFLSELSKKNLTYKDACEKIEVMLNEYESWLKASGMKYRNSTLNALFVGAEELAKLLTQGVMSPLRIAKPFFEIRRRKAWLLDGETKAPGRQLAYLIDARRLAR